MNTAVINIKTEPKVKREAKQVAQELGLSLSAILNAYLKELIKTKTITFSSLEEIPNEATQAALKRAEADYKKGNTSPAFKTGKEAVAWFEKQGL